MISYYRIIILSFLFISIAHAEIILDGTLGPQIELTGPNFAVEAKLGQQAVTYFTVLANLTSITAKWLFFLGLIILIT